MTTPDMVVPLVLALCAWSALLVVCAARAQRNVGLGDDTRDGWAAAACVPFVVAACSRAPAVTVAGSMACIGMAVAAVADAKTGYLFDAVTFPNAVGTATVMVAFGRALEAAAGVSLLVAVFGAIVVCSRGRALGLGDVKAMYAIGAGLGPAAAAIAVFAASISAIIVHAARRRNESGRASRREIPFGPHLAVGSAFALVASPAIVRGLGL